MLSVDLRGFVTTVGELLKSFVGPNQPGIMVAEETFQYSTT